MRTDLMIPEVTLLAPALPRRRSFLDGARWCRLVLVGVLKTLSFAVAGATAVLFGRGFGEIPWPWVPVSESDRSFAALALCVSVIGMAVAGALWITAEWVAGRRP